MDYAQMLREAVLKMPISPEEKANGLNILEQIIDGADTNQLIEQISNGTVPVMYFVKKPIERSEARNEQGKWI